ncbi:MAG: nuclear transport factor 2 family protein [Proteobacteria bacterium]|nr:nuclear transport factor 2 family protein [Pseudomonadota bacterium]
MTTEATRAALEDLVDAFQCGDHERLAARYHDDIDWLLYAPMSIFPFAGVRRGKSAVLASLLIVYQSYRIERYSVALTLVDGDRAASISEFQMVQRSTGQIVTLQMASFHRFEDGKLIEYRCFIDSFDSASQALGRDLDVAPASTPSIPVWMTKPPRDS